MFPRGGGQSHQDQGERQAGKLREVAWRSFEVLLLLWAWFKCWYVMYSTSSRILKMQDADIRDLAPLAVLVVGFLATSVLGFLHYHEQERPLHACIAALNLDTPHLACRHGLNIVLGETNHDWETLRIRHSIWRSLPLAMMTFVLTCRNLTEIPACQVAVQNAALAVGAYPQLANRSQWGEDLRRDLDLGLEDVSRVEKVARCTKKVEEYLAGDKKLFEIAELALRVENQVWQAAHCHESEWQRMILPENQDRSQHWLAGEPVSLEEDGELGGLGSGSILAMNFVIFSRLRQQVVQNEATLKPAGVKFLERYSQKSWYGWGVKVYSRMVSWETMVDEVSQKVLQNRNRKHVLAVQSGPDHKTKARTCPRLSQVFGMPKPNSFTRNMKEHLSLERRSLPGRPWKVSLGSLNVYVAGGWKLQLGQTFVLLLAAFLPIRKRILTSCRTTLLPHVSIVTLHTVLDILLLVAVWLLCVQAPLALHVGKLTENMVDQIMPLVQKLLLAMSDINNWSTDISHQLALLTSEYGLEFQRTIQRGLLISLKWDAVFFLRQAAGSLLFLVMSSAIARALCPNKPFADYCSVGICGPLWLLGQISKEDSLKIRGASVAMICRSLLWLAILAYKWYFVDRFSVELFVAAVFNRLADVDALRLWGLAALALHCLSGLAAIYSAQKSMEDAKSEQQLASYHTPTYGSFPSSASHDVP